MIYFLFFVSLVNTKCSEEYLDLSREEVTGGRRKVNSEELHNLFQSLNIIRMVTSRRMRWMATRVYPIVSGLAAWSENCKWYSSLPLGAVVSLFYESA
jgi:hypothetical protein